MAPGWRYFHLVSLHSVNYGSRMTIAPLILFITLLNCSTIIAGKLDYVIRKATPHDQENLLQLHQKVATTPGGLARSKEEITEKYIKDLLSKGINRGIALVVEYQGKLIGSMIKYRLKPQAFSHVLTKGNLLVDPEYQGKGIGTELITSFLAEIKDNHPDILRIEIIARESNPAIRLYGRLGFTQEGRFEKRIKGAGDTLEADIPMVWINPNFNLHSQPN